MITDPGHPHPAAPAKRAIDITIAGTALLVVAPVILGIAILVLLATGPGPMFVMRVRSGAHGRPIRLRRLRTRSVDRTRLVRGVTFGRTLERTELHRLPELWSVVRGDLSLVGPRPMRLGRVERHDPTDGLILDARPGLTGLAQVARIRPSTVRQTSWVGGHGAAGPSGRRLDVYYVEHPSIRRDVEILARAAAGFVRRGARHTVHALPPTAQARARTVRSGVLAATRDRLVGLGGRDLLAIDLVGIALAVYVAMALRFDALGELSFLAPYWPALLTPLFVRPVVGAAAGLYARLWQHATLPELVVVVRAVVAGSVASVAFLYLVLVPLNVPGSAGFPRSFWIIEALLSLSFLAAPRVAIRALTRDRLPPPAEPRRSRRALLYGAGEVGALIARSAAREPRAGVRPVGFLDDDPAIAGQWVAGLRVFGGADALGDAVALTDAEVLLITMANAPGSAIRRVTEIGMAAGLEVRTVPPLDELLDGSLDAFRVRRVQLEDLIRRPQVSRRAEGVAPIIRNRTVLVTGAGGSIGSELASQVHGLGPRRLIAVDRAESPMYDVQRELEVRELTGHGRGEIDVRLADVTSRDRMRRLIGEAQPDLILHAAAYKHVPLMEDHPSEAVQVNVGGTLAVLDAAVEAGTPRFVLVSTDKAVDPSSVMGATKRLAEWLVADCATATGRPYVAVRFGNVIGSAGSVVPIFRSQLESGRPLTITHPEMTRYFMTIPEASSLILEAAALGHAGDLFVLDMGEPLRIVDLARDFVRLAGRDPDSVPIVFTGLRPGEKLHEQLFYDHESARPTANPKVMLADGATPPPGLRAAVDELLSLADGTHDERLRARLFALVGREPLPVPAAAAEGPAVASPEPLRSTL